MELEEYIAQLNAQAFWKEFTFSQTQFSPKPGSEVELADNFVWLGNYAIILQLKEREEPTGDPEAERDWFSRKILGKATRQVRDSIGYLREHEVIRITNERGHPFDIRGAEFGDPTKVIVYLASKALPADCRQTHHYVSRTAGFIHILAVHDYLGVLEKLRVPEDIRRYFQYREKVVLGLASGRTSVQEWDIVGGFLNDEDLPGPDSHKVLERLLQDLDEFDLSGLISNLYDHIPVQMPGPHYHRIMLEFARAPRAVWREIKKRFVMAVDTVKSGEFTRPFRLAFPASGCSFMIAALDPSYPVTGPEGERIRLTGLQNLTRAACYDAKMARGIGILISREGDYFQIDWCHVDEPWAPDPEMDAALLKSNPFRPAREKSVDGFLLFSESAE